MKITIIITKKKYEKKWKKWNEMPSIVVLIQYSRKYDLINTRTIHKYL